MDPAKHIKRSLAGDINEQTKFNKRHGGVSDTLKRMKKRPGGTYNIRTTRRDGFVFMRDVKPASWLKGKKWGWKPPKKNVSGK